MNHNKREGPSPAKKTTAREDVQPIKFTGTKHLETKPEEQAGKIAHFKADGFMPLEHNLLYGQYIARPQPSQLIESCVKDFIAKFTGGDAEGWKQWAYLNYAIDRAELSFVALDWGLHFVDHGLPEDSPSLGMVSLIAALSGHCCICQAPAPPLVGIEPNPGPGEGKYDESDEESVREYDFEREVFTTVKHRRTKQNEKKKLYVDLVALNKSVGVPDEEWQRQKCASRTRRGSLGFSKSELDVPVRKPGLPPSPPPLRNAASGIVWGPACPPRPTASSTVFGRRGAKVTAVSRGRPDVSDKEGVKPSESGGEPAKRDAIDDFVDQQYGQAVESDKRQKARKPSGRRGDRRSNNAAAIAESAQAVVRECEHFAATGKCKYEDKCKYLHVERKAVAAPAEPAAEKPKAPEPDYEATVHEIVCATAMALSHRKFDSQWLANSGGATRRAILSSKHHSVRMMADFIVVWEAVYSKALEWTEKAVRRYRLDAPRRAIVASEMDGIDTYATVMDVATAVGMPVAGADYLAYGARIAAANVAVKAVTAVASVVGGAAGNLVSEAFTPDPDRVESANNLEDHLLLTFRARELDHKLAEQGIYVAESDAPLLRTTGEPLRQLVTECAFERGFVAPPQEASATIDIVDVGFCRPTVAAVCGLPAFEPFDEPMHRSCRLCPCNELAAFLGRTGKASTRPTADWGVAVDRLMLEKPIEYYLQEVLNTFPPQKANLYRLAALSDKVKQQAKSFVKKEVVISMKQIVTPRMIAGDDETEAVLYLAFGRALKLAARAFLTIESDVFFTSGSDSVEIGSWMDDNEDRQLVEFDMEKFDSTISTSALLALLRKYAEWGMPENLVSLYRERVKCTRARGKYYRWSIVGTRQSGRFDTTIGNSLLIAAMLRDLNARFGYGMRALSTGDDLVLSFPRDVDVDLGRLVGQILEYGFVAGGDFVTPATATFCSASFCPIGDATVLTPLAARQFKSYYQDFCNNNKMLFDSWAEHARDVAVCHLAVASHHPIIRSLSHGVLGRPFDVHMGDQHLSFFAARYSLSCEDFVGLCERVHQLRWSQADIRCIFTGDGIIGGFAANTLPVASMRAHDMETIYREARVEERLKRAVPGFTGKLIDHEIKRAIAQGLPLWTHDYIRSMHEYYGNLPEQEAVDAHALHNLAVYRKTFQAVALSANGPIERTVLDVARVADDVVRDAKAMFGGGSMLQDQSRKKPKPKLSKHAESMVPRDKKKKVDRKQHARKSNVPAFIGRSSSSDVRRQENSPSMVIKHAESQGTLTGSTGFSIFDVFPINPGYPGTFPWGSTPMGAYEMYHHNDVEFWAEYIPSSGPTISGSNPAVGTVTMAFQYDEGDAIFLNQVQMDNYDGAVTGIASQRLVCRLNKNKVIAGKHLKVRTSSVPTGFDPTLYDCARFTIATNGQPASNNVIGNVYFHYRFRLDTPRDEIGTNGSTGSYGHFRTLNAATTASNLGTVPGKWTGNILGQVTGAGGAFHTITFSESLFPGTGLPLGSYVAVFTAYYSGSTTTTTAMPAPVFVGATALNAFDNDGESVYGLPASGSAAQMQTSVTTAFTVTSTNLFSIDFGTTGTVTSAAAGSNVDVMIYPISTGFTLACTDVEVTRADLGLRESASYRAFCEAKHDDFIRRSGPLETPLAQESKEDTSVDTESVFEEVDAQSTYDRGLLRALLREANGHLSAGDRHGFDEATRMYERVQGRISACEARQSELQ